MNPKKQFNIVTRFRNIAIIFLTIITLLFLPFLAPITSSKDYDENFKPFENSKFININGIQIHYREWNANLRSPDRKILFIHGFYSSTDSWTQVADRLSKSNDYIIALDIPGFGFSSKKTGQDHSTEYRSKLAWDFLNEIDKNTNLSAIKWTIAGHSMGGGIALNMTLEGQQRVRELILIDPAVQYSEPNNNYSNILLNNPIAKRYISVFAEYYFFQEFSIKSFLSSAYSREPSGEETTRYLRPLKENGSSQVGADIVVGSESKKVDVTKIINRTLIIWGEKDTWVEYKDAKYLDENIPLSELNVLENTGHVPQETNPDVVAARIKDFWGK